MEEVLNGYVTNPNPTPTLTPNPNPNPNRINKNPKRNDFTRSIGRFAGWKKVLTSPIMIGWHGDWRTVGFSKQ